MRPFDRVISRACPIDVNDVDTDQILPKQFLKRIERTGFGPFAFADWRYDPDGTPKPEFSMNRPEHAGAEILVAGRNFGCGSSREHAPWALEDAGFRAIVAPSFADIFRSNCGKIGVLCVAVDEAVVRGLFDLIAADPATPVSIDLEARRLSAPPTGTVAAVDVMFHIDEHTRRCLLEGLDHIALTLAHEDRIGAFEASRPSWLPSVPVPTVG